jgi:hypothetical protein
MSNTGSNVCPVLHGEGEKTQMSYEKHLHVFSSILLLALATGTAWANDRSVPTVKVTPRHPAPTTRDNDTVTWQADETNTQSTLYEGARWNSGSVITWSLAEGPGTDDSPFSGYMGAQYEELIQRAFQAWAAASGLSFERVADSGDSDIRVGWGDFNTPSTWVVGHTTGHAQSGQFLPGVIIRLEDPSQDALVAGAANTLTYSGTTANFYAVILHEIGHAVGLADNDDPKSIMYYESTGAKITLADDDIAGIRKLYGRPGLPAPALQAAASEVSRRSVNFSLSHPAASIQSDQSALPSSALSSVAKPSTPFVASNPRH